MLNIEIEILTIPPIPPDPNVPRAGVRLTYFSPPRRHLVKTDLFYYLRPLDHWKTSMLVSAGFPVTTPVNS